MNKIDGIIGGKMICCNGCGYWFPSDIAFVKLYSRTAFMICPKCANKLEQDLKHFQSELARRKYEQIHRGRQRKG